MSARKNELPATEAFAKTGFAFAREAAEGQRVPVTFDQNGNMQFDFQKAIQHPPQATAQVPLHVRQFTRRAPQGQAETKPASRNRRWYAKRNRNVVSWMAMSSPND